MARTLTFDPREVDEYVRKLGPRRELVYRLAFRRICDRCRGDRAFKLRTDELLLRFGPELDALRAEAEKLLPEFYQPS